MPFKSKAQRRKFAQLLVEGKIKDETYEEWNRSTGRKELPERVTPKPDRKKAAARKGSSKAKAKPGARVKAARATTKPKTKRRAKAR